MGIPIMCGGGGPPSHRCEPWPRCDEGAFWTRDTKLAAATVGPFKTPFKGPKRCDPWPECLHDGPGGLLKKIGLAKRAKTLTTLANPGHNAPELLIRTFFSETRRGGATGRPRGRNERSIKGCKNLRC